MLLPALVLELLLHMLRLNIKSRIPIRKVDTISYGKERVFTIGPRNEILKPCSKEKINIFKPAEREAAIQGCFSHYSKEGSWHKSDRFCFLWYWYKSRINTTISLGLLHIHADANIIKMPFLTIKMRILQQHIHHAPAAAVVPHLEIGLLNKDQYSILAILFLCSLCPPLQVSLIAKGREKKQHRQFLSTMKYKLFFPSFLVKISPG